ncbi:DUF2177 family protein [Porticoccaceae bacterium]|jgi:uncharacterized membrane protein|nr:DUF2177 family protein [Porticoccaceae bacterium]
MKDFLIIFVLMILTDLFYLKTTSKYFEKQIFLIQKTPMTLDLTSALFCYLFLSFGLYYFIIKSNKSLIDAFLLGLVIYGVFDTTNKALFSKWKWNTVLFDTLWGGVLFLLTTYIYTKADQYFN